MENRVFITGFPQMVQDLTEVKLTAKLPSIPPWAVGDTEKEELTWMGVGGRSLSPSLSGR